MTAVTVVTAILAAAVVAGPGVAAAGVVRFIIMIYKSPLFPFEVVVDGSGKAGGSVGGGGVDGGYGGRWCSDD